VALLNHLLDDQGDVLVRIVRDATLRVDGVEDRLLQGRLTHKRSELGKLRRVLVRLQRLLAPEPGALFRLLRDPLQWIAEHDLDELRQATEEFSLVLRDPAAAGAHRCCRKKWRRRSASRRTGASHADRGRYAADQHHRRTFRHERRRHTAGRGAHGFLVVVLIVVTFTLRPAGWPSTSAIELGAQ
jgi:zinc transporter